MDQTSHPLNAGRNTPAGGQTFGSFEHWLDELPELLLTEFTLLGPDSDLSCR